MVEGREQMLRSHAKHNGLSRIDIGTMAVGDRITFIATVWWDRIGHEIPCATGIADNATAAIGIALDAADQRRAEEDARKLALVEPIEFTILSPTRAQIVV